MHRGLRISSTFGGTLPGGDYADEDQQWVNHFGEA
jgi:hypothetical protein